MGNGLDEALRDFASVLKALAMFATWVALVFGSAVIH